MSERAKIVVFPTHRRKRVEVPLTKRELAERWGKSVSWIEQRMRRDGLPYRKDARSRFIRFDWTEVETWRVKTGRLG